MRIAIGWTWRSPLMRSSDCGPATRERVPTPLNLASVFAPRIALAEKNLQRR